MLGTVTGNVYGIKLGIDVETELGSLDKYFDGCNSGKLVRRLLGE